MASRAIGEPKVSGGAVEGERRWPRAGVSEQWRRGRATVASRANGEPGPRGQPRCRRGRAEVASILEQRSTAVASRATGGGVGDRRWRRLEQRWRTDERRERTVSL